MKTVNAKIVIGINKGYGHNNKLDFNEKISDIIGK
jgi:hypothetical protein